MNVLITGGAGFIGSNFIRLMSSRHGSSCSLINIDKLTYAGNLANLKGLPGSAHYVFIQGDIRNRQLLEKIFKKYAISHIVNFAAETHVDRSILGPRAFIETNVLGVEALLSSVKAFWCVDGKWKSGVRFVQISTDEVYGTLGSTGKFSESTPVNPRSPYSASKASADLMVSAFHETYGMPVCITRCSNNYGPYQFPEKLIPLMIRNLLAGLDLPVYGDGKQVRDWLHVIDHCSAVEKVLLHGKSGGIYNIGGNNEQRNIDTVRLIISILGKLTGDKSINEKRITHVKDRAGHDRRYAIDASYIRRELGWTPKIKFKNGLEETVKWYLKNKDWMESIINGSYRKYYSRNYGQRI